MKTLLAFGALLIPAVLVLVTSFSATAQDRRAPRRTRVTVLETQEVFGNVQKPNAFYVIPRTRPAVEERDLRTGRLREVVRTVQRAPF